MSLKDYEIERFEHAGRTVVIYCDTDAPNPREWDNLATLCCWHRRENLGDRQIPGMGEQALRDLLTNTEGEEVLAIVPLWLYQHSGMSMRASKGRPGYPFNCQWDSGQVGWGYVTKARAIEMGCVPGESFTSAEGEVTKYDTAFFENAIIEEVGTYDDYLTGRCFGYQVLDEDGDVLESCWGFYEASDAKGPEYTRRSAKEAAEYARSPGQVDAPATAMCDEAAVTA